jgi:hypothetical protein
MKSKERDRSFSNVGNSSYVGLFVIYLVSAAVAATVILPGEEHWYFGVIKSCLWPLYVLAKLIS